MIEVGHFQEYAHFTLVVVSHDRVGVFGTSVFAPGAFVTSFMTS